jgi:hypothetical protein
MQDNMEIKYGIILLYKCFSQQLLMQDNMKIKYGVTLLYKCF